MHCVISGYESQEQYKGSIDTTLVLPRYAEQNVHEILYNARGSHRKDLWCSCSRKVTTIKAFQCRDVGLLGKLNITDKASKLLFIDGVCYDTT